MRFWRRMPSSNLQFSMQIICQVCDSVASLRKAFCDKVFQNLSSHALRASHGGGSPWVEQTRHVVFINWLLNAIVIIQLNCFYFFEIVYLCRWSWGYVIALPALSQHGFFVCSLSVSRTTSCWMPSRILVWKQSLGKQGQPFELPPRSHDRTDDSYQKHMQ